MSTGLSTANITNAQSIDRIRKAVAGQANAAFAGSMAGGLVAGILYIIASNQRSLPKAIAYVGLALICGLFALLILNELLVMAIDPAPDPDASGPGGQRSRSVRFLRAVVVRRRWAVLGFLVVLMLLGIGSLSNSRLSFLRGAPLGESYGTLLTVGALVVATVWVQAWQLSLERGVLVFPEGWLVGGLVLAVAGAGIWSLGRGTMSVAGALAGLAGLVAVKMSLLPLVERVTSSNGDLPAASQVEDRRRIRAVDLVVAGAVVATAGAMLLAAGAAEERPSFLTLGLLAAIIGLSLAGVAAVCLTFRSPTVERLVGTASIAVGVLATTWGTLGAVEAAGDWLWLVLIACAIPAAMGAWFVFRGEGIFALALLTFVMAWAMHDREPQHLDQFDQSATTGTLVAIGDSFMSGEGASEFLEGTNSPASNQCRRALTAYSALVARELGLNYRTFACSGAKMTNLRLDGKAQMPFSPPAVPGAATQLTDVVRGPRLTSSDVVLVSIGGNDTGFSPIIQACLLPANCAEHEDQYIAKAESLEAELSETYQEIDEATGDAVMVVVPYPNYIKPTACDRLASGDEFEFVDRFIGALNNTIARAARKADVLVANTSDVFAGRTQCDDRPAANLIVLAPPAGSDILQRLNPANWVHGTMHPYNDGHRLQADRLGPLVGRLQTGCAQDGDCRPNCGGGGQPPGPVVAPLLQGPEALLVNTCARLDPVTDPDDLDRLATEADLLLQAGVGRELYESVGLLVWPFMALASGGLLIALGLINRQGPLAKLALFLAPIQSPIPTYNDDDQLHVVPLSSDRDRVTLLGVVARSRQDRDPPRVDVELRPEPRPGEEAPAPPSRATFTGWTYFAGGRHSFWWSKVTVDQLRAGTAYRILGPGRSADARLVTLPDEQETRTSIIVGSCYYRANIEAGDVAVVYQELVGNDPGVLNFWLGDQVYLDQPWKSGLRATDLRDHVAKRYLDSWEIGSVRGHDPDDRPISRNPGLRFGYVLRQSSNRFLPDDHEFWSGYPKISYRTLPRHALSRHWQQLTGRPGLGTVEEPITHPSRQGTFGSTAGLAYMIFQSPVTLLSDPLTDNESPEALQRIDIGRSPDGSQGRILMVDTRWRRTTRTRGRAAGFLQRADLDRLVADLDDRGLVILMLSRPLAGYPPRRYRAPWGEQAIEHYRHQYDELCRIVADRAPRQPTVVVAGDVHDYALHTAGRGSLLQIVSSPIVLRGRPHGSHNPFSFPDLDASQLSWLKGDKEHEIVKNLSLERQPTQGGLVRLDIDLSRLAIGFRYRQIGGQTPEQSHRFTWSDGRWIEDREANGTGGTAAP